MKIKSGFAILDVTQGRRPLARLVKDHPGKVPVTIKGWISGVGNDDGWSTEFDVQVESVSLAASTP